jgi:hypothetical protein
MASEVQSNNSLSGAHIPPHQSTQTKIAEIIVFLEETDLHAAAFLTKEREAKERVSDSVIAVTVVVRKQLVASIQPFIR